MKKITEEAVNAFMNWVEYKNSNTQVVHYRDFLNDCFKLVLHWNVIAKNFNDSRGIYITTAGWTSNTTKERLNGLPGVNIKQKNYVWFLNGEKWNWEWKTI